MHGALLNFKTVSKGVADIFLVRPPGVQGPVGRAETARRMPPVLVTAGVLVIV